MITAPSLLSNGPPARPEDRAPDSTRLLPIAATASLVLAGLSLAAYAAFGFISPDWTVAGPGLLVAAAGLAGLRARLSYLAGLLPIGAVLSVAGPTLAYDLARPGETIYFVGTVLIIVGGCLAAVFGVAAAVSQSRRALLVTTVGAIVSIPVVMVMVVGANSSSAASGRGISETERQAAVDVELIDFAFVFDADSIGSNSVIRLRNTGSLPHDFTVADLDVAVHVPSGRETFVRMPTVDTGTFQLICTVGDHAQLGMQTDLAFAER